MTEERVCRDDQQGQPWLCRHLFPQLAPRPEGDALLGPVPVPLLVASDEHHWELALPGFVYQLPEEQVLA